MPNRPRKPQTLLDAALHREPRGDAIQCADGQESAERSSLSERIVSLAQLLTATKTDLAIWEVERHVVNKWEVGARGPDGHIVEAPLFQVKAWLRRKRGPSNEEFRAQLLDDMRRHAPRYPKVKAKRRATVGLMYELGIVDVHVGKLGWHREVGENYDVNIARDDYLAAVEDLLSRVVSMPLEKVLLPVGNDFLHADNLRNETTAGTRVDTEGRWQRSFTHARKMAVAAIDRMREVAPVEVVIVPGNHDKERSYYLGDTLESWYRLDDRVKVDNEPTRRKYVPHGVALLGFTHGDQEKHADLPLLMADEVPKLWAAARHREVHVGHFHKSKETKFVTTDTHGRTVVRVLPALSGVDAWHVEKGYRAARGSEAFLWDRERGYLGHYYHMPAGAR